MYSGGKPNKHMLSKLTFSPTQKSQNVTVTAVFRGFLEPSIRARRLPSLLPRFVRGSQNSLADISFRIPQLPKIPTVF
jgi:hypothetical protein